MKTCEFCEKNFVNNRSLAAHTKLCSANPNKLTNNLTVHVQRNGAWNKGKTLRTIVLANCLVCSEEFEVKRNSSGKPHLTCSRGCSNTYYRTGSERIDNHYRTICFRFHPKICVCCDEINIIHVHHYDEDHSNNDPANLVPLCPTHHQYVHSRYKYLVNEKIDKYVQDYLKHCKED